MNSHCVYCGISVESPLSVCRDCGHRWRPEASAPSEARQAAPAKNSREAASRLEALAKSKSALASAASYAQSGVTARYVDEARARYEREVQFQHERARQAMSSPTWDRDVNERFLGLEAAGTVTEEEAMAEIREAIERREHERYMGMMATPEDFAREQKQQDKATFDAVKAKIEELRGNELRANYDDEGKFLTVGHVKQAAEVLSAMKHLSENDDTLVGEPWFTYEQIIQRVDMLMTELVACMSTLNKTGLIEVDPRSMRVRLRSHHSFKEWRNSPDGQGSQGFEQRMDLRARIYKQQKMAREKKEEQKKVNPAPWVYRGASEEALLAVEAMHPQAVRIKVGTTPEGIHVYSVREVADHRPFEVIFDALGHPVEEVNSVQWSPSRDNPEAFRMVKDLIAALITKLERASIGYLCRGCGELDPDDMQAGTDWHLVITQDHDPSPGGHSPDGECLTCPVEVPEQCGPIVKVGGCNGGFPHTGPFTKIAGSDQASRCKCGEVIGK